MVPPMSTKHPVAELIDILVARAPDLIRAGITSLTVDGVACTLSRPLDVVVDERKQDPVVRNHLDPLQDASSYTSGKVPGFDRDKNWSGR